MNDRFRFKAYFEVPYAIQNTGKATEIQTTIKFNVPCSVLADGTIHVYQKDLRQAIGEIDEGYFFDKIIDESDGCTEFEDAFFKFEKAKAVVQCTGLRDKNGALIFEDDIVQYYKSTAWGLGGQRIAHIYYDDENAFYSMRTTYGDLYNIRDFDVEKIGTIHENPELLERET